MFCFNTDFSLTKLLYINIYKALLKLAFKKTLHSLKDQNEQLSSSHCHKILIFDMEENAFGRVGHLYF